MTPITISRHIATTIAVNGFPWLPRRGQLAASTLSECDVSRLARHANETSFRQNASCQPPAVHTACIDPHRVVHELQTPLSIMAEEYSVRASPVPEGRGEG